MISRQSSCPLRLQVHKALLQKSSKAAIPNSSTMMAIFIPLAFAILLPVITAAVPDPNDKTHSAELCETPFEHAYNGTLTAAMNQFSAAESPAFQAPLLGIFRVWLGLGLARRQNTCSTVCRATGGGCCTGCTEGDGSIACGDVCCRDGSFCSPNTECLALT